LQLPALQRKGCPLLLRIFPLPRSWTWQRYEVPLHRTFCSATSSDAAITPAAVMLVESPAKAKKIQEYLGPSYRVIASYGHIRDLPAKTGSVIPDQNFELRWELVDAAKGRMAEIADAVARSVNSWLVAGSSGQ